MSTASQKQKRVRMRETADQQAANLAKQATTIQAVARGMETRRKARNAYLKRHASHRTELLLSNRDSNALKDRPSRLSRAKL